MIFDAYGFLFWVVGTALRCLLIMFCWRGGIHRLLPRFQLLLGWEVASNLGAYPAILIFGYDSNGYTLYYFLTGAVRGVLQVMALLEVATLARVRVASWVWAGSLALGSLVLVALRDAPGFWAGSQLFQTGFLHLGLWLLLGIVIEALRQSHLRLGWNIAGVLLLILTDIAARYTFFLGQVFVPIDYSTLRWFFQPVSVLSLTLALACMRRLEVPVFLNPQKETA